MAPEVFLDTSFAVALSASTDQLHDLAVVLADQLTANNTRLITTQGVLLEIGYSLAKKRYRAGTIQLLKSLEADASVEIIPLTMTLYGDAFNLFQARPDKEWCMIDCVSFMTMTARGITSALTADEHFEQGGFRTLLREP